MTTATETAKFEVGSTYSTRSACDYECIFSYTVTARSAKFITVVDRHNQVKRVGVKNHDQEGEWALLANYSMAPVIRACKKSA